MDIIQDSILSVKLELEQTKEEREYEKKRAETLLSDLTLQRTKAQQLARNLETTQQEVPSKPKSCICHTFMHALFCSWQNREMQSPRLGKPSHTTSTCSGLLTRRRKKHGTPKMPV